MSIPLYTVLIFMKKSKLICNIKHKSLGFFPAETWISNGFAIDIFADLLRSVLNIALDHESLNEIFDFAAVTHTMKNFLRNTNLLKILLA